MTTGSAAENLAGHAVEKKDERVEKRRALGRGLESLLPGPRVVSSPQARVANLENSTSVVDTGGAGEIDARRTGMSDPHESVPAVAVPTLEPEEPGEVISIQAVAETRIPQNLV